jgi:hypothetical protein
MSESNNSQKMKLPNSTSLIVITTNSFVQNLFCLSFFLAVIVF